MAAATIHVDVVSAEESIYSGEAEFVVRNQAAAINRALKAAADGGGGHGHDHEY